MKYKNPIYIATISGGKDSVTMCDLLLINGHKVDYIIFQDTLMEFQDMYIYIEKLKKYFKDRHGKDITVLKPSTTFEAWCFGVINDKNSEKNGFIRGIPPVFLTPCYWRRESKVKPSDDFIKKLNHDGDVVTYIGFTADEKRTVKNDGNKKYEFPLRDIFKMKESDCKQYLLNQDMENPLYRFFDRTGCAMCPAQSDKAWYEVYKNFPSTWKYMMFIESRLEFYEKSGMNIANKYWFNEYRSIYKMESNFKKMEKQQSLFGLSNEPLRDCFCKF